MTDIVEVKTVARFKAWRTPPIAEMVGSDDTAALDVPVDELRPEVIDALAGQGLDHVYASVGRNSPFRITGQ